MRRWLRSEWLWATMWLSLGMALRAWSFGWFPLREDEALYGYWARLIASGLDPMLERVAVDKPPFFIYALAHAFRWLGATVETGRALNLACSFLALFLVWALARRIYGARAGRWALALYALSPFAIAFAPTLYTDPMLVAWILLALVCAAYGLGLGAGLALGMAFATKQNALLFTPLIAGALLLGQFPGVFLRSLPRSLARRPYALSLIRLLGAVLGFVFIWHKVWQWDGWRILPAEIPSFWQQSWNSYGGMALVGPAQYPDRLLEWWGVWRWLGGWLPGTLALAGLVAVVGIDAMRAQPTPAGEFEATAPALQGWRWDRLFLIFTLAYLAGHVVLSFQAWDRYLLGVAPMLALLATRGLLYLWDRWPARRWLRQAVVLALALALAWGAGLAASARIPVGGDHGAYAGIEQVAAYLQRQVPADHGVLYQRWLGWHWRWYLWEGPAGRVYWSDPDMLVEDMMADVDGYRRFVVFPGWELQERPPLTARLAAHDMQLSPRLVVRDSDSADVHFVVYEITPSAR